MTIFKKMPNFTRVQANENH